MLLRAPILVLILTASAFAGPPLTVIQDVLYKADGDRFNGIVTISWSGFEAYGGFAIATQSITAKIVDGNLRVRLVPCTTASPQVFYNAVYNSDGRIQFGETWAVPPSDQPLHLKDVRVTGVTPPYEPGGDWPPQSLSSVAWQQLEATLWTQLLGTTWQ